MGDLLLRILAATPGAVWSEPLKLDRFFDPDRMVELAPNLGHFLS